MSGLEVLIWRTRRLFQIRFIAKSFLDLEMLAVLSGDIICSDARTGNNRPCRWTYTFGSGLYPWLGPRAAEGLGDARSLLPEERADPQHPTLFAAIW